VSFFVLILLALLVPMSSNGAAPSRQTAPAQRNLPDPQIEQDIRARFARSKISVNKFTVRVQGGVATIEGKTNVIQHKATATRLAKLAGARSVRNQVEISEQGREKAAKNLAEGRRRAQVKRSEASTKR
jgi:hypothetical protein